MIDFFLWNKYDMKNIEELWGKVEYGKMYKYFEVDKK